MSPFKAKMAMAVRSKNAHWKMQDILRRHWVALGARHGVLDEGGRWVEHLIDAIAARTPEVIANVRSQLPKGSSAPPADAVFDGMQGAAKRLA
jgi:serine/threonine-protein kinase HipA